jgi:hypothetical protein
MSSKLPVSVQSFCFRNFTDNAVTAGLVKGLGLSGIEVCGRHCDFSAPAAFPGVVGAYRSAGLSVVSAGVVLLSADDAANRNTSSSQSSPGRSGFRSTSSWTAWMPR